MKTNPFIICSALGACLLVNSCFSYSIIRGNGDLFTEHIRIGYYTEIEASNSEIDILYTQSDEGVGLSVVADRNILEKYDIRVVDGKLKIQPQEEYKHTYFKPTRFVVTTHSTHLNKINIAGSVSFTANSPLRTDLMDIDVSGRGKICFNDILVAERLTIDVAGRGTLNAPALKGDSFRGGIAGSGKLHLGGHLREASFHIAGSGTVRAFDLQVDEMRCNIAGSGDIEISVNNRIDAEIAGSGHIKYKGNPPGIRERVAGSGSIKKVD